MANCRVATQAVRRRSIGLVRDRRLFRATLGALMVGVLNRWPRCSTQTLMAKVVATPAVKARAMPSCSDRRLFIGLDLRHTGEEPFLEVAAKEDASIRLACRRLD